MMRSKEYSEVTAEQIDAEIKRIIDEGYHAAKTIIETHRDKLEIIANALLEYETLDGAQVDEIVRTGNFTPPPKPPANPGPVDGSAGGNAVAGNSGEARAAETARPGHANARAGNLIFSNHIKKRRSSMTAAFFAFRKRAGLPARSGGFFQTLQIFGEKLRHVLEPRHIFRVHRHQCLMRFQTRPRDLFVRRD